MSTVHKWSYDLEPPKKYTQTILGSPPKERDSSVGKAVATQSWEPQFDPQNPHKSQVQ